MRADLGGAKQEHDVPRALVTSMKPFEVAACCGKVAGPAWGLVLAADRQRAREREEYTIM